MEKRFIFMGLLVLFIQQIVAENIISIQHPSSNLALRFDSNSDHVAIDLVRSGESVLTGKIGTRQLLKNVSCIAQAKCKINDFSNLEVNPIQAGFNITWVSEDLTDIFEDCFDLGISNSTHWYGGPQRAYQVWPLEKMVIEDTNPYVIRKNDNFGVAERYWLNSKGVYIYLDERNPLWVDQNNKQPNQVCFKSEAKSPYINRWRVQLTYVLVAKDNLPTAHLDAVNNYLGKPSKHPGETMIGQPIWTTWAKYKRPINDESVLEFAKMIRDHGYKSGQLEIDDMWESCYGSQEFDKTKFANITNTVKALHDDDWRVSLWVHPFVNDDCENNSDIGKSLGYFVQNPANESNAEWWNGNYSHQIDFTKSTATKWWTDRLKAIQETYDIDSFKFDAGEVDYVNQPGVFQDVEHAPNILTENYIAACVEFGDLIEVRSSFRAQRYGEFIRMLDKDSTWDLNNGLASLITTLLQLNMNGYVMVLPDMIGGNGYAVQPTAELLVRWTQANTFMPSMQFSILPWDFNSTVSYDIESIVKKYVNLHEQYVPVIVNAMDKSIEDGTPVNPPIWWVDPTDEIALAVDDEYLLGEDILVAPVVVEGAISRDVYLPQGQWKDGNNGTVYKGPITLKSYSAPIEVLPYFIKQITKN